MMKFWGLEVPAGKEGVSVEVETDEEYVHVSQAALGPNAKDNERIVIQVETADKQPIVLGTLVKGKCDQMQLDLVFETSFRLSHTGNGSVYMVGYETQTQNELEDDDDDYDEEEDEEDEDEEEEDEDEDEVPKSVPIAANGKPGKELKDAVIKAKPAARAPAAASRPFAPMDEDEDEDEEDEDEEDGNIQLKGNRFSDMVEENGDDDEEDSEDFEADVDEEEDDEEEEEDEDEEDEDEEEEEGVEELKPAPKTPVSVGAKRPAAEAPKTPKSEKKKVRVDTPAPHKSKKAVTPAPAASVKKPVAAVSPAAEKPASTAKPAGKTPKTLEKPKETPKAAPKTPSTPGSQKKLGDYECSPCNKKFASEMALKQHSTSKHAGQKS